MARQGSPAGAHGASVHQYGPDSASDSGALLQLGPGDRSRRRYIRRRYEGRDRGHGRPLPSTGWHQGWLHQHTLRPHVPGENRERAAMDHALFDCRSHSRVRRARCGADHVARHAWSTDGQCDGASQQLSRSYFKYSFSGHAPGKQDARTGGDHMRMKRLAVGLVIGLIISFAISAGVWALSIGMDFKTGPSNSALSKFCDYLYESKVGTGIRESVWVFPILEGSHLLGIALSVGELCWFDLRLLGLVLSDEPVGKVWSQMMPV